MKTKPFKHNFLLILFFIPSFLFSIGNRESQNTLTIYSIRGSSGIGLIRLFESPPSPGSFNVRMEALSQSDLIAARFLSGEAKIGILPPNVAAIISASGRDIRLLAVIGQGMLSLVTLNPELNEINDLRGQTVMVAGQGAVTDYVFRSILVNHGIDPEHDINLNYSLPPQEIAQSLIAGRITTALLPEPFATMVLNNRSDVFTISDIQGEWESMGGTGNYPITLLVADGEFIDSYPNETEKILNAVSESIEWVRNNPLEAGVLTEQHELGFRSDIVSQAIPNSNYIFIPAPAARSSLESLYRMLYEFAPQSIGGAMPPGRFYRE